MTFIYIWAAVLVGFVLGAWWKSRFMVLDDNDPYETWKEWEGKR